MRDNNKALLSELKSFQRLQYLLELQERLTKNNKLKEARESQRESNSSGLNPII
ncbi:MAG: hypothetical protein ACOZCL_05410 [Bacillota bacterium]